MPRKRKAGGLPTPHLEPTLSAFETGLASEIRPPLDALQTAYYTPQLPEDPFAATRPPTVQEALAQESAVLAAEFQTSDRLQRARQAVLSGVDCQYFFCVVFVSAAQKDAFLTALDWLQYANETGQYVNGVALAHAMGVSLPPGYLSGA